MRDLCRLIVEVLHPTDLIGRRLNVRFKHRHDPARRGGLVLQSQPEIVEIPSFSSLEQGAHLGAEQFVERERGDLARSGEPSRVHREFQPVMRIHGEMLPCVDLYLDPQGRRRARPAGDVAVQRGRALVKVSGEVVRVALLAFANSCLPEDYSHPRAPRRCACSAASWPGCCARRGFRRVTAISAMRWHDEPITRRPAPPGP